MSAIETAYQHLLEYALYVPTVDTHEHLPAEAMRVQHPIDFTTLFSHYCRGDLQAAGMPPADLQALYDQATPLDRKWALFEPWYDLIQDGSYARAAHIAMARFYGRERLTSLADAEAVSEALQANNTPGLYRRVLKEACGIVKSMNFGSLDDDPEFFAPVININHYAEASVQTLRGLEAKYNRDLARLDLYLEALHSDLVEFKARGMKGLKTHCAYMRDLHFAPHTQAEAEGVFNRIVEEGYGWRFTAIGYEEARPLQDFIVHRMAEWAAELEMPFVIHSALQADVRHKEDNAKPLRLWNLIERYRHTDFVLLHSGLPWMEEACLLAKHYDNVYLDMAWDHIMSPELSTRAVRYFVDLVPRNKVFGFGGDFGVVEKVYGHLTMAREDLSRALAHKVTAEGMPLARAEGWLTAMLHDNPARVFHLEV